MSPSSLCHNWYHWSDLDLISEKNWLTEFIKYIFWKARSTQMGLRVNQLAELGDHFKAVIKGGYSLEYTNKVVWVFSFEAALNQQGFGD